MIGYLYILGTLFFTIYGQVIIKWRLNDLGKPPEESWGKIHFLFNALFDSYIISGFASAFIAAMLWMAAMTRFELTKVYPFMSLAPALVFLMGVIFLNEQFTWGKVIGLVFIVFGTIITVRF